MFKQTYHYVHQIQLPSVYNKNVNCYLLEYDSHYILLDTGENTAVTKAFWEELLPTLIKPISHILISHIHTDHAGCCHFLSKLLDCPIIASEQSATKLNRMRQSPKNFGIIESAATYGCTYPYYPKMLLDENEAYDFKITETFQDGDILQLGDATLQAIHTPGHAVDQYCFYDAKEEILFSSDHLIAEFNPVLIVEESQLNPLIYYLDALNKMKAYPIAIAFTGHGEPIENCRARINEIEHRHFQKVELLKTKLIQHREISFELLLFKMYQKDLTKPSAQLMQLLCYLNYLDELGDLQLKKQDENIILAFSPFSKSK